MPRLFISYRRADAVTITGRIHDRLVAAFGNNNVFKDVDDIPLGVDFRTVIEQEITVCDVVLVIIGPQWLNIEAEDNRRRLDDPNDFVRLEVELALTNSNIVTIPVLVHNAFMPVASDLPDGLRALAFLNAAAIRDDPDFNRDINRLVEYIKGIPSLSHLHKPETDTTTIGSDDNGLVTPHQPRHVTFLRRTAWIKVFRSFAILIFFYLLVTVGIVLGEEILTGKLTSNFEVGSVAPQNVAAPFSIIYISDVLTEQTRVELMNATAPVYHPPDPYIARQQSLRTRQILDFINDIRHDPYGTPNQKITDLQQIDDLSISSDMAFSILTFDHETWTNIANEVQIVLERIMRESIRESDLSRVRNQLPTQISINFNTQEAAIIMAIVKDLIQPNTFINSEATQHARELAATSLDPIVLSIVQGELVIRAGEIISEADIEALNNLGLLVSNHGDLLLQTLQRGLLASLTLLVVVWLLSPRLRTFLRFLFSWRVNIRRVS